MVASQPDSPGSRRVLLVDGVWVVGGFGGFALDASDGMDVGPSGSRVNITASVESNSIVPEPLSIALSATGVLLRI